MTAVAPTVQLRPIDAADRARVGTFLHAHLNARVSPEDWMRALDVPWTVDAPNGGFMLVADGAVVGAQLAFYSERIVDGRPERFCNLGALCVLEPHRLHVLRLVRALLSQEGYHFVDLSPSGTVPALNARLGFERLDTTTALVPNLPWPSWRGRITSDPAALERTLTGAELALYRDHAGAGAARHLLLTRGHEWCYVIFRKDRRRGMPGFASILHVSHPEVFRAMAAPLARHLLLRHGAAAMLAEARIVGQRPPRSLRLRSPRPKMFKSSLDAARIDDLYSELVCVSW